MTVLLDTHAFLWWLAGDPQLTPKAQNAISKASQTLVSAVSAWEIVTKYRLGKLPGAASIVGDIESAILAESFVTLALTVPDAQMAANFPFFHRDPFDRMLIAQSIQRSAPLISNETLFDQYGVVRIW